MDSEINQRIRYYRKLRGFTQTKVAEMIDMKISTYSQCERRGSIDCERLIKLSQVLGVSCNTLLFGEDSQPPIFPPEPEPKPETPQYTPREQSLIGVIRGLTTSKRNAVYKIVELIWKKKLDPFDILTIENEVL